MGAATVLHVHFEFEGEAYAFAQAYGGTIHKGSVSSFNICTLVDACANDCCRRYWDIELKVPERVLLAPFRSFTISTRAARMDGERSLAEGAACGKVALIPGAEILVVKITRLSPPSGRRYLPAGDQSIGTKID